MLRQFDAFATRNLNALRDLGALTLAGSEELVRCQVDHAQALVARGSQQLKEMWSEVAASQGAVPWTIALRGSFQGVIGMARECAAATADYQAEALRLVQRQAIEVQDLVADMLDDLNAGVASGKPVQRSGKAAAKATA